MITVMRPGGATEDLAWTPPKDFRLETVVPDGAGGLYLVAPIETLHLPKGAKKPKAFCKEGSSAGAALRAPDGALWLGQGKRVVRVAKDGSVRVVAKGFEQVFGIALDARGRLHVSDWERGEVVRVDGTKHTVLARGLSYPSGLVFDARGRLYVKESGRMTNRDMTVRRIDAKGRVALFATVPSVSRFRAAPEEKPPGK